MGSFSIWHWLIVLVVVVLIFGTKKLRNLGADLGGAVKGFKEGMGAKDGEAGEGRRRAPSSSIPAPARPLRAKSRTRPSPEVFTAHRLRGRECSTSASAN